MAKFIVTVEVTSTGDTIPEEAALAGFFDDAIAVALDDALEDYGQAGDGWNAVIGSASVSRHS